jgi:glycosyltransferase involved in cell wall biosynthesis
MRILIVNSDAFYEKENEYYIHKSTGSFVHKITEFGLYITLFQFEVKLSESTVSNYALNTDKVSLCKVKRSKSKLISHLKALFKLVCQIRDTDFLYLFYPNAFYYGIIIAILFNKPYGIYLRGEKNIKSNLSRYFYRNAKFVTSISPAFTKLVTKSGGNGITIKPMIDFDLLDILNKAIDNNPLNFNLLYIGRVEKDKGIFELIDAIKILKDQNITNVKLNIIGNGVHYVKIKTIIDEYELSSLINLHGVITDKEQIKSFYLKSNIFVFPSHHEGFPRVLYEAMLFNVPIVTTFVGTIPYLMKDKFNCIKLEVNSPKSISDNILYLMKNTEIAKKIALNATDTIIEYLKKNNLSHEEILLNNI